LANLQGIYYPKENVLLVYACNIIMTKISQILLLKVICDTKSIFQSFAVDIIMCIIYFV
jgi:hypothetical protein